MKNPILFGTIAVPFVVVLFVAYRIWQNEVRGPLPFKSWAPDGIVGLISWLFLVALFLERAVEVVVMVFRDEEADLMDESEERARR